MPDPRNEDEIDHVVPLGSEAEMADPNAETVRDFVLEEGSAVEDSEDEYIPLAALAGDNEVVDLGLPDNRPQGRSRIAKWGLRGLVAAPIVLGIGYLGSFLYSPLERIATSPYSIADSKKTAVGNVKPITRNAKIGRDRHPDLSRFDDIRSAPLNHEQIFNGKAVEINYKESGDEDSITGSELEITLKGNGPTFEFYDLNGVQSLDWQHSTKDPAYTQVDYIVINKPIRKGDRLTSHRYTVFRGESPESPVVIRDGKEIVVDARDYQKLFDYADSIYNQTRGAFVQRERDSNLEGFNKALIDLEDLSK